MKEKREQTDREKRSNPVKCLLKSLITEYIVSTCCDGGCCSGNDCSKAQKDPISVAANGYILHAFVAFVCERMSLTQRRHKGLHCPSAGYLPPDH